jgi:hypothetical protein
MSRDKITIEKKQHNLTNQEVDIINNVLKVMSMFRDQSSIGFQLKELTTEDCFKLHFKLRLSIFDNKAITDEIEKELYSRYQLLQNTEG